MRRREFIGATVAGGVAWSAGSSASRARGPTIGFLGSADASEYGAYIAAFRQSLADAGFADRDAITIEYRWANNDYARLPALAADLVHRDVAVIVTAGGDPPALAAKAATSTIPIVFNTGSDPVKLGLAERLSRPGGNATGVSFLSIELEPKRLELLRELLPRAKTIGFLLNPQNEQIRARAAGLAATSSANGQELIIAEAKDERSIEGAFASLAERQVSAVLVGGDGFFRARMTQIVALAAKHNLPASYNSREFVLAGGLMGYGTSLVEIYRQVGVFVSRVLKGAHPAGMPVEQATKVEMALNLRTARALGLTIPLPLLGRADEVIE